VGRFGPATKCESRLASPEGELRFIQLRPFSRKWDQLGLDDEDLRALELMILAKPDLGPVVRGTGGVRKARFAGRQSGKGKSGSFRVYYIDFDEFDVVLLITIFAKSEISDMSEAGKQAVAAVVEECRALLGKGAI